MKVFKDGSVALDKFEARMAEQLCTHGLLRVTEQDELAIVTDDYEALLKGFSKAVQTATDKGVDKHDATSI